MTEKILEFKPFTAQSLESTKKSWLKDAEKENAFLPDVEQQMDWVEKHIEQQDDAPVAYGVFTGDSKVATAVCELVVARLSVRSKWIKMLRLRLRPSIDAGIFSNDPKAVTEAVDSYICCVVGVLGLKKQHQANTIKIYGRTQEQIKFLTLFSTKLQDQFELSEQKTIKSSIEGRWLVIRWN